MKLGSLSRSVLVIDGEIGDILHTIPVSSMSDRTLERLIRLMESELQERDTSNGELARKAGEN